MTLVNNNIFSNKLYNRIFQYVLGTILYSVNGICYIPYELYLLTSQNTSISGTFPNFDCKQGPETIKNVSTVALKTIPIGEYGK